MKVDKFFTKGKEKVSSNSDDEFESLPSKNKTAGASLSVPFAEKNTEDNVSSLEFLKKDIQTHSLKQKNLQKRLIALDINLKLKFFVVFYILFDIQKS